MARHDDDRAVEQHALRAEQPVGDPGAEDRGEVDGAAVGADDAGCRGLVDPEAALGDRVVHVEEQDALHAVEAEALPHLDAEDVHERPRLPEEALVLASRIGDGRGACAIVHETRLVLPVLQNGSMTDPRLAIIVLAAGQGTRMQSSRPKVLHPLAGVPIVGHVLATARELSAAHVVAVVRHEREAVAAA